MKRERTYLGKSEFSAVTRDIEVFVFSEFLSAKSVPEEHYYVWSYHIEIKNLGNHTVQLLNRYWKIIDAKGRVQEVVGAGVVGKQPLIAPGAKFEYQSGTQLNTPSGVMLGCYEMGMKGSAETFGVSIPAFSLDSPHEKGVLN
ncbi:MAG: Co2+/Mg2+ efflux protein ApaG [Rickettsiales bacterium]|jgi:ApaG protein|nr:Co2+/Mg2+ efflux protein ApaG [Rickettsiales bacterium]